MKKWIIALNFSVLVIISIAVVMFVLNKSFKETAKQEECIDINNMPSLYFQTCYNRQQNTILMEISRGKDNYKIKNIKISFFDTKKKEINLIDIPKTGAKSSLQIKATKNPKTLKAYVDVVKDFSAPICDIPRKINVPDCPTANTTASVEKSTQKPKSQKTRAPAIPTQMALSDIFSPNLVSQEASWTPACQPSWDCTDWGPCDSEGYQRRTCIDENNCPVEYNFPDTVKKCSQTCVEKWVCKWTSCQNGFTTPVCQDLNKCGTQFNIPQKIKCIPSEESCKPSITCSDWSECQIDYNFANLVGQNIKLSGKQTRTCRDSNNCIVPAYETRNCSLSIDIYTQPLTKCGIEYIGIYNKFTNKLIARIEPGSLEEPYLNIHLDDGENQEYCDYCYDGILDGDEEQIDCGGSCPPCQEVYPAQ